MTDELDLTQPPAEPDPPKRKPGRPKGSRTRKRSTSQRRPGQPGFESRVRQALEKAGEALIKRKDAELGEALIEEAPVMAGGVNNLSKGLPPVRFALLVALDLIEPVLAFWRVGRILLGRAAERRLRRAQEAAEAAGYANPEEYEAAVQAERQARAEGAVAEWQRQGEPPLADAPVV